MIESYATTTLRTIKQHKQHFFINLTGLSIGLAAAILIALYAYQELSYDQYQPDADNTFRIEQNLHKVGLGHLPSLNYARAQKLLTYPEVTDLMTLAEQDPLFVKAKEREIKLAGVFDASDNIEEFIALNVLHGDLKTSLTLPHHIALSESEANRLFGTNDVIGRVLQGSEVAYTVGAVFEDLEETTHYAFKSLVNVEKDLTRIRPPTHLTYIKLSEQTNHTTFLKTLSDDYLIGPEKRNSVLELNALTDIHFSTGRMSSMKASGSLQAVMMCIALSIILLGFASFNFINMSMAQSSFRAKEIGMRKTLGASRTQLVSQFMLESLFVTLLAAILALVWVEWSLPTLNQLVDRQLNLMYSGEFFAWLAILVVSLGGISGAYPAFYMASFDPKRALSGELKVGKKVRLLRKVMQTVQAGAAMTLIITALILPTQLQYLQALPKGYQTDARLSVDAIPSRPWFDLDDSALMQAMKSVDGVEHLTLLDTPLTSSDSYSFIVTFPSGEQSEEALYGVGTGFGVVDTLGLTLLAGRDFSSEFASDRFRRDDNGSYVSAIITDTVRKQAGFKTPEAAIGQVFTSYSRKITVVGVVSDIAFGSAKARHARVMFLCDFTLKPTFSYVLKYDQSRASEIQADLTAALAKHARLYEPEFTTLTVQQRQKYRTDHQIIQLLHYFTMLAIGLACLGTYGLAAHTFMRRQKEVAIRQVIGASRFEVMNLIAKEYLSLIGLSMLAAIPVTYWLMTEFLAQFNEQIAQPIVAYLVGSGVVFLVTWVTVALMAYSMMRYRPARLLRIDS